MLVHICCSVDCYYFLERIKEDYPSEEIVGFYYNPNIHPLEEYNLRLLDVKYSCNKLGIKLIEGPYDIDSWFLSVKGKEHLEEKGERCTVCFDKRMILTAIKAKELGHKTFTTTLLISPKKAQDKLAKIGSSLESIYNLKFIFKDYRSNNGTLLQNLKVKENSLYRQNYCGCIFALEQQRKHQNKIMDEMLSPLNNQILPQSIKKRFELYKKRNFLEDKNKNYKILKRRFLNYRLLNASVSMKKKVLPSYVLHYSTLRNGFTKAKIDFDKDNIYYLNRDEVKLLTIEMFNKLLNKNYKNVTQLMYDSIDYKEELKLRKIITNSSYDLSSILILDKVEKDFRYDIKVESVIYNDIEDYIIEI